MTIKTKEYDELRKSLSDVLSPEELDDIFKSEEEGSEEELEKEEEEEEEDSEKEEKEEVEKSKKKVERTEEEVKKSIASEIGVLKELQGYREPSDLEKSLKITNDKLEKSISDIKTENDDLKKSMGKTQDLLKSLESKIEEIGGVSQGTKHQINFKHLEKSGESDLQMDGKIVVSVSDKDEFEKSLNDAWEASTGTEKDLLEKAVLNLSGSGRVAQDADTMARIQRAMAKQDIILTK